MVQPQTTTIPNTGSGTINIHINNPSVGAGVGMPQYPMPYPYPVYYPYYSYPANYYMGNMGGVNQNMTLNGIGGYPAVNAADNAYKQKNINETTVTHRTEEKQKQREVVVLTDNYIKNLENYLRSNNVELRKNAVKEILMRFKEDKGRMDNPSLTALLNIALQDPNGTVRSVAMTTLEAGYAKGNALTEQILRGLQTQKTNYASDAIQASDGLLQMSKTKALVPDNSFYKDYPVVKTKTERSVENAG